MTEEDDIDGLAAEYVLGSLDPTERADVAKRRKTVAALDESIEAWQRRLGPLSDREPGIAPPPGLYNRVLSRIARQDGGSPRTAEIIPLRRPSSRRHALAIGGAALAACLALAIARFSYIHVGQPSQSQHAGMDCGRLYKEFWERFDRQTLARMTADQLADVSRLALRAHDACAAGDEQNAATMFDRLSRSKF
jgi:anti-sigma-K factor RskA